MFTRGVGSLTDSMVMVFIQVQKILYIRVCGKKISNVVMARKFMLMVLNMLDSSKIVKRMVKESINLRMDQYMMENG